MIRLIKHTRPDVLAKNAESWKNELMAYVRRHEEVPDAIKNRYNNDDIANVIRCILKEFVYYKYIERAERERREKFNTIAGWKVINPVYNYFYDEWRCKYQGGYPGAPHDRLDRYYRAKKAVESYAAEHVNELVGKSIEELQTLYKKIFRETD